VTRPLLSDERMKEVYRFVAMRSDACEIEPKGGAAVRDLVERAHHDDPSAAYRAF